jgi:hypothetical protein
MSFAQLIPALPVTVEEKGAGYAVAVIDYGQEHNLIWVVERRNLVLSKPKSADVQRLDYGPISAELETQVAAE